MDLALGEHGEQMLIEVLEVTILGRLEGVDSSAGDGHVDGAIVVGVGVPDDESVSFQSGDDARDPALAQRGATAKLAHLHRVMLGKDGQEQKDLELMKGQTMLPLERAVDGANERIAGSHQTQEGGGTLGLEIPRSVGPLHHSSRGVALSPTVPIVFVHTVHRTPSCMPTHE